MDFTSTSGFDVYWWQAADSPRLCRYATKNDADIERFSAHHVRFRARPLEDDDGDDLVIILRLLDGRWFVKSDSFDDISHDYPFAFAQTGECGFWTDALGDELMVIQSKARD